MSDESIPLFDGELSGATIIPSRGADAATQSVRSKRGAPRRSNRRTFICFSPDFTSGRIDHAECPLIDISTSGMAIEYDEPLTLGATGRVSYLTVSHQPVHTGCRVCRCEQQENGQYQLGLRLDRKLNFEETKPAMVGLGQQVSPGIRTRRLREPASTSP